MNVRNFIYKYNYFFEKINMGRLRFELRTSTVLPYDFSVALSQAELPSHRQYSLIQVGCSFKYFFNSETMLVILS
jgi:hypothetical protein